MSDSVNPHGSSPSEQVVGFRAMYDAGPPPWDIGRPQPAFLELAEQGVLAGRVLDVGCGTGEHALMAAARGLDATGIDAVPRAITLAQRKARDRGLAARFLVWDALKLPDLGEEFDTVVDSGLFHVFDDEDRRRFVASLHAIMPTGSRYHLLCFSDRQPGTSGPASSAPVGDQSGVRATGLASRCHRCCDDGYQYGCHRRKRLARQRHPRLSASRTLLGCSAGDVAADLLVSAAVVHGTPAAAEILGLIKKNPWAAGASLEPEKLRTSEQLECRQADRPKHRIQLRGFRPGQQICRIIWRQLGVSHGVRHEWPQVGPIRRRCRSFGACRRAVVDLCNLGESVDQDASQRMRSPDAVDAARGWSSAAVCRAAA